MPTKLFDDQLLFEHLLFFVTIRILYYCYILFTVKQRVTSSSVAIHTVMLRLRYYPESMVLVCLGSKLYLLMKIKKPYTNMPIHLFLLSHVVPI